jgi:hypothetical protein
MYLYFVLSIYIFVPFTWGGGGLGGSEARHQGGDPDGSLDVWAISSQSLSARAGRQKKLEMKKGTILQAEIDDTL